MAGGILLIELPHAPPHQEPCHQQDGNSTGDGKPPRLIERRRNVERELRGTLAPHAVLIGCEHPERIAAWCEIGVVRDSRVARVLPILVNAVQSNSKSYFLRLPERSGRVPELRLPRTRRQRDRWCLRSCKDWPHAAGRTEGQQLHDRWNPVPANSQRIDSHHTCVGGEPKAAVVV